jgi:hypothetical protein
MTCSNCETKVLADQSTSVKDWLLVSRDGELVARLCGTCQRSVLTLKIVLHRDKPDQPFQFEGYLPVETAK